MLRKTRLFLAVVFFVLITLLLLDFTGTLHHWLGWMARIQVMPAILALNAVAIVVLVALTLVFGRVYCSVICPLGVLQDIVARLSRKRRRNRYSYSPAKRWLRYSLLALMVVAVAAGLGSLMALLDPYGNYGRIATNIFQPVYIWINNGLAAVAGHYESYAFYNKAVWLRSLPTLAIAVAMLVLVAVLAWRGGRTYCNTLCPVGTLLGELSRFSLLKVRFDADKCRSCSLCSKGCKASCIDFESHKVDYTRCVACGDCIDRCKFDALHYGRPRRKPAADDAPAGAPDKARRAVLLGTAIVAADVALAQAGKKVDGGLAAIENKQQPKRNTPITPPGSVSAKLMTRRCTACQLCVQQCPNEVLRPSSGLMTLMQPVMSYERGFCRPECVRCSEVCPTGAIQPIGRDEKSAIQIGHAVYLKQNCVIFTDSVACGNCARHCPAGAIEMVPDDPNDELSEMRPAVNPARCIGCGACEYVCPARPFSAIYVEGHEVHNQI